MKRKAFVTGSKGFVGSYLTQALIESGDWDVTGFNWRDGDDIRLYGELRDLLDATRPDAIFHLAARPFVPESFLDPEGTMDVNLQGSLNLLEAVHRLGLKTKIHLAGSSEEYGDAQPVENGGLNPRSPYAVSKLAMEKLGLVYADAYGMNVVVTRAFNHTGPGRGDMYGESAFAKRIVEFETGKLSAVTHGNLDSVRNYTDVRDMVRAYMLAIDLPSGTYNICSDRNVTMQEVMDILVNKSKSKVVKFKFDRSLKRPNDFSFKVPRCRKFTRATGWKPEIPLEQTLEDLLNYWRERV